MEILYSYAGGGFHKDGCSISLKEFTVVCRRMRRYSQMRHFVVAEKMPCRGRRISRMVPCARLSPD